MGVFLFNIYSSLIPEILIYLFLFILVTVGLFPLITLGAFYTIKTHFREFLKLNNFTSLSFRKREFILSLLVSLTFGLIFLFFVYKRPEHWLASALLFFIPSALTTLSGYLYIRRLFKLQKDKDNTFSQKGLLVTLIIWSAFLLPFSLFFPSIITMLFLAKTVKSVGFAVIYVSLLLLLPFFSPLIFLLIVKDAFLEQRNKSRSFSFLLIGTIILLIMAFPVRKWILVAPLSIAKIGYFEAQILDRKANKKSVPILVIWKSDNRIVYTEVSEKGSKNGKKDSSSGRLRERELSANEELIYIEKSLLELPLP